MILINIFNKYINLLQNNSKSKTPELDCKILVAHILNINYNDLYLYMEDDFKEEELLNILIKRRIKDEPISKIINKKTFWEYNFYVDNNVLDPRPDSENLIELILENYNINDKLNILDLGTGSGCLIITLLNIFKNSNGIAVDINEKSLNIAMQNAKNLNVKNINFIKSNWNDNVEDKFDIIISNPPYIKTKDIDILDNTVKNFDPILALDGGDDGLKCYKYIAKNIMKNCKQDTKIFLEIGYNQTDDVIKIFEKNNFLLYKIKKDLNNYNRILSFNINEQDKKC